MHPVRADMIRHHQRVHARCADRARMAGKHQQIFLPGILVLLLTAIKFSHR